MSVRDFFDFVPLRGPYRGDLAVPGASGGSATDTSTATGGTSTTGGTGTTVAGGSGSVLPSDVLVNAVTQSLDQATVLFSGIGRTALIIGLVVGGWYYRKPLGKFINAHVKGK